MPTFITLYRFTDQGIRSIKDSPGRMEAAIKAGSDAGGTTKGVYVTLGQYDLVAITEWPSDEMAAAAMLAQASLGNVSTQTMRAFTQEEFLQIVEKMPSP